MRTLVKAIAVGALQPFYKDQALYTVLTRPDIPKSDIDIQQPPIFSLGTFTTLWI
jgi:hypothetical protein